MAGTKKEKKKIAIEIKDLDELDIEIPGDDETPYLEEEVEIEWEN